MMDLIIENSASKQIWLISGLTPSEANHIYISFEDLAIPDECPDGEYYYALIANDRDDVEYQFKTDILDTIVKADEIELTLRDLNPIIGVLKLGETEEKNVYLPKDKNKTYYYKK